MLCSNRKINHFQGGDVRIPALCGYNTLAVVCVAPAQHLHSCVVQFKSVDFSVETYPT